MYFFSLILLLFTFFPRIVSIHVKNECYSFNFLLLWSIFLFVFCLISPLFWSVYISGVNSSLLLLLEYV